ncbi:MAG: ATP-binding cassette domain-containing protein [Parahaliea sp.]
MDREILLKINQLSLVYKALPVLKEINWSIITGQQWACIGPNGAGKTSLARVISGQEKHFSGKIERSPTLLAQGVAYVCFEQAKALCEHDSKMDDSEFRADASDPGTRVCDLILAGKQPDSHFKHWVERLQIGHILERGLRYISTGEMRKTLLLTAILARPRLLILDSPTDGLDRNSQQEMSRIIAELQQSDTAVLLLCRSLGDIPGHTSDLLVLDEGRILSQGAIDEVLAQAEVQRLMNPSLPALAALPPALPRPYSLPDSTPLLKLRNVSVSYGELKVLDNINWTFERHQHCAISGPNGCGKTTLLSLITGDNHKAYGQDITLFGLRRGSGESVWDIKQKYGVLDTNLHLNFKQRMAVLEVVVSGFFDSIGLYDNWADPQKQSALAWLHALGLGNLSKERFDTLSFGLQRMVLLARAMVKSPAILILDEPTLGLDSFHRALILRAIDHIAKYSDTRILFVSHSAGEVPACINQFLTFEAHEKHYQIQCEEQSPAG